ncbi:MAG: hypothetical protein ACI4UU_00795 [Clostridia bacterium]
MKNTLKIVFVIIGSIIGAGFASGQEIYLFFNSYGTTGIIGMIVSCLLTGVIIYKVISIVENKSVHTYSEFLAVLNPNKKINKIIKIIIQCFLLISFYIMIAGFCAYFKQEFGVSIYITAIIIAVLCYITFINDTKGIVSINAILIPFLAVFIVYLGIKNIPFTVKYFENNTITYNFGWLFSSILYASYNSILLIPILIDMPNHMNIKNKIKQSSILCSVILSTLGICLFLLLLRGSGYVQNIELPMILITKEFGNMYPIIYGIVILIAIFTSAIASGYGFLKNVTQEKYKKTMFLICFSSILIAPLGFSKLVNLLYPIFGILGLAQIYSILKVK